MVHRCRSFLTLVLVSDDACSLFFLSFFSTDDEIQEMIDEADRDNDGKINAEEFFRVMKKRGENPLDDWDSGQPAAEAEAKDE